MAATIVLYETFLAIRQRRQRVAADLIDQHRATWIDTAAVVRRTHPLVDADIATSSGAAHDSDES